MEMDIQLTREPVPEKIFPLAPAGTCGAWLEFRGLVRSEENGRAIAALEYEAYSPMAENQMRRILESLASKFPCLAAKIIHRLGVVPAGETAIYVGLAAAHRGEAMALLAEFLDRLKQDVPIWKRRALPATEGAASRLSNGGQQSARLASLSFDEARRELDLRCAPLPAVRASLAEAFGRVLREEIRAPENAPATDKSTRDGYAILQNDPSETFQIVETIQAADWKPRPLKTGQTVRVATGASLPCENCRVVMQENVERHGDTIKILRREKSANVRRRGEEWRAGEKLLSAGTKLDAGALALLAAAGIPRPLVSPRLRIGHFTTGEEIVPPEQTPGPGQVRDSNSILIRGLLQAFPGELFQRHLPEDFQKARHVMESLPVSPSAFDLLLVSGGASAGETDFTRALLEWLDFEIIFARLNLRPGRPLIFGVKGRRLAFGLPGNPLSHFVCFHLFVAAALAKLIGAEPKPFLRGPLAKKLDTAPDPRETFWPAQVQSENGRRILTPLPWHSSGDVACLPTANALIRLPPHCGALEAGEEVEFLPTH
jgi:molybdopterin molybdotransferase